jgi:predicted DNA-binding transcriptional regulator AlpA
MREPLLRLREVCLLLRIAPRTMRAHVRAGTGPAATRIGSLLMFSPAAVDAYVASRTKAAT